MNTSTSGIDLALLRFALQHTDSPNLHETQLTRNPEEYEWLKKALNNLENDAQKMKKLLEIVKKEESSREQKVAALEELQFYVEDLDNANDFVTIGGLPIVAQLLEDPNEAIQFWALWILGTLVQNNPKVQQHASQQAVMDSTLRLLKNETSHSVKEKALFALTGLMKEAPHEQQKFLDQNGLHVLSSFLSHPNPSTRMKTAHLLNQLVTTHPGVIALFVSPQLLAPVMAMAEDPDLDAREKAVTLLVKLVSQNAQVRALRDQLNRQDQERRKAVA